MEYNNLETGRVQVTQHSMSFKEKVNGLANRLLYSSFYTVLYITMIILSLFTLVLSIKETCPTVLFIILEVIINTVMIFEVGIRMIALGQLYWESKANIVDLILVIICVITLIVLATGCSKGATSEAFFDSIVLAIRNLIQFIRLFATLRKNKRNLSARENTIDFTGLSSRNSTNANLQHFDNEYSLQQIATSDGFVLDDDEDEI